MLGLQRRLMRTLAIVTFTLAGAHGIAASAAPAQAIARASAPAVVAQAAAPAATDAANTNSPAAVANDAQAGFPWWAWLVIALLVIGVIVFFFNRKKDPTITTRGGSR